MNALSAPPAPVVEPREPDVKYTTAREADRYHWLATSFLAGIWVLLIGAMFGWLHPAWLVLCPYLYVRFELYAHELLHCRSGKQLNPLMRHMMVAQSVYHMDYDAYRLYHLDHHRYLGTPQDPEYYLVSSSTGGAFLKAMFCIEVGTLRYLRLYSHDFTARDWGLLVFRIGVFAGLLAWNWPVFLIYLGILRLGIGVADFYFHHVLHNDNHRFARLFRWSNDRFPWFWAGLLGRDSVAILLWHDEHHAFPRVAARCLNEMTPALPAAVRAAG